MLRRMKPSKASATWNGDLKTGKGTMKPEHGPGEIPFSLSTRFEGAQGSNPEEVVGAALSGCFSMALSLGLEKAGMKPLSIQTRAEVHLGKDGEGFAIQKIELFNETRASGGDDAAFQKVAAETKKACPLSKALASVPEITLKATLTPG